MCNVHIRVTRGSGKWDFHQGQLEKSSLSKLFSKGPENFSKIDVVVFRIDFWGPEFFRIFRKFFFDRPTFSTDFESKNAIFAIPRDYTYTHNAPAHTHLT